MPTKIYAPNVHLFAFHLKENNHAKLLWEKCNYLLSQKFSVPKVLEIEEGEGYRVDLLKNKTDDDVSLQFNSTVYSNGKPLPITGFATPLRINDSYVLTLNLRHPEFDENQKKTNLVDLDFLKLLNPSGCLIPSEIGACLGQTILLTVWYTPDKQWLPWKLPQNRQKLRELADNCLKTFISNNYPCPDFKQEGQLFGSPIFEYGIAAQEKDYCHVLVWVYCESITSEIFVDNYNNFVNLFFFSNKIVAAYHRSRKVSQAIKQNYQDIENYLNGIFPKMPVDKNLSEAELNQFKHYLKDIPQKYLLYSQLVRELDQYHLIIKINAQNYRREIRDMQSQLPSEDICFLSKFANEDCYLFTEQIQADLGYFQHGTALLEKAMAAIQGRVIIEQADSLRQKEERDKLRESKLQNTIQSLGVGIGVGTGVAGVFSQTFPLIKDKKWVLPDKEHPILAPHPFLISFSLSVALGAFLGWLAWRYFKRHLDSRLASESSSTNNLVAINSTILPVSANSQSPPVP